MTKKELSERQHEVVLVHKRWKEAVAAKDTPLAATLDTECRHLRNRIVAAKQIAHGHELAD